MDPRGCSMTAAAVGTTTDQRQRKPWDGTAQWARLAILLGWVLLLAITFVLGERQSTLRDLQHAVAAGEVHEVHMTAGLSERGRGFSIVEVHWRRGLFGYTTEVIEARPRSQAPHRSEWGDATAVIGEDLGTRLRADQPGLEVVQVARTSWSSSLLGWQLPGWTGLLLLVLWVSSLMLLALSPEPWRATRWAWFWLMGVAAPVGVLAYLLLAGPTPLMRRPGNAAKRLTGGWAFLLAVILSSVGSMIWSVLSE